jgi:protein gp37
MEPSSAFSAVNGLTSKDGFTSKFSTDTRFRRLFLINKTKIEYLDYTTNPIVGCSGIGCAVAKVCWAYRTAKRHVNCECCVSFVPHVHWERFNDFMSVKKPSRIGVAFMGEFYDKEISNWVRKDYYMHMLGAPQHRFIIFTKQPQNIDDEPLPNNLSIGVSVNRKDDLWRIDRLREIECQCRIASFEPLYEHLDVDLTNIDWVIIGAQKRPDLQPKQEWVHSLMQYAKIFGAKIFLKNNLQPCPVMNRIQEYPEALKIKVLEVS